MESAEVERLFKLETMEDVKKENDKLLLELELLKKKFSSEGMDVSASFQKLENKFMIIENVGKLLFSAQKKTLIKKGKTKNILY